LGLLRELSCLESRKPVFGNWRYLARNNEKLLVYF